jgi:hypothetical protein
MSPMKMHKDGGAEAPPTVTARYGSIIYTYGARGETVYAKSA